jgi:hypothetical protein
VSDFMGLKIILENAIKSGHFVGKNM